jgi:hypothetical protein
MSGSHWVALCISDSGYADYFDSYGLPPYKLEIMSYLQNHSTSWTFNRHRLQGLTSNACGHYCCLYALHRARGLSMTLFTSMFTPAHYRCNDIRAVRVFRAVWRVPRLQPLGASVAVMQVSSINKGTCTNYRQSKMSILVIDFTYLEGKDGELVVKELAAVDSHSSRVSSYVFKRPYSWKDLSLFNVRLNEAIDHGCNWNDGFVPYSDLENVVHCKASSAVTIYCFGPLKTEFISNLINRTVIDITQLGCPPIPDINLSAICMSQVKTCLCTADSLFSSSMATLLHCQSAVCKLSCSTCISLMFSRCGLSRYFGIPTT